MLCYTALLSQEITDTQGNLGICGPRKHNHKNYINLKTPSNIFLNPSSSLYLRRYYEYIA